MIVREDGVISVQEASGSKVVEHADGTCITTFYQEAKEGQVHEGEQKQASIVQNCNSGQESLLEVTLVQTLTCLHTFHSKVV